jgi:ABC-type sugar transport system permease subunit
MTNATLAPAAFVDDVAQSPEPIKRRRGRATQNRGLVLFALPSVIWYLIFTLGPLFAMFYLAFFDWRGLAAKPKFSGLDNFVKLFNDERIPTAFINTGIHMLGTLPFMMVASFMLGYFLNLKLPGHRILRVIMFIPALISLASLGTMFAAVLGPTGLVNSVLDQLGLTDISTAWFANPATAMGSLIFVTIWSGTGFNAILFSARLSSVDEEIYNAAELDGANHWQKMWRVAFPIAIDYFGVLTMLQYLWTLFGSAGLILILTKGGPGQVTSTLSWLVYRFAFNDQSPPIGYSQTIGIILFVLGVIGLLVIRRVFRQRY